MQTRPHGIGQRGRAQIKVGIVQKRANVKKYLAMLHARHDRRIGLLYHSAL